MITWIIYLITYSWKHSKYAKFISACSEKNLSLIHMTALTPINQLFGDLKDGWKQREEIVEFLTSKALQFISLILPPVLWFIKVFTLIFYMFIALMWEILRHLRIVIHQCWFSSSLTSTLQPDCMRSQNREQYIGALSVILTPFPPPKKKIRKEMRYWEKNWFAVGYDTSYASLRNRLHFITRRRNVNYAWSLRKFLILYWFDGSVVGSVLNPFQAWKYAQRHINWFLFDIISIFLGIIGNLWIGAH